MNYEKEHRKLMAELAAVQRPNEEVGLFVNIHHRLCSDKIQWEIKEKTTWKILKVLPPTKSGAKCVRVEERNFSKKPNELIVCNINSDRFQWVIFTEEEVKKVERLGMLLVHEFQKSQQRKEELERLFKKEQELLDLKEKREEQLKKDKETAAKILENCTEDEQKKVSFTHLVLADLIWLYIEPCQNMCINWGVQETKKLSRAINDFREKYDEFLKSCMNQKMIDKIRVNSMMVWENESFSQISHDAWGAIEQMYKYKFGTKFGEAKVPYLKLRICAQLGRMMVKCYDYAIDQSNAILQEKMKGLPYAEKSAKNPMIDTLDSFLDAYQGDYTLEYDSVMRTFVERWNEVFNTFHFYLGEKMNYNVS